MSTFMANASNIERKWYILDAAGKPLGKTAVRAADILRGKTKPTFTPNADCGSVTVSIQQADKREKTRWRKGDNQRNFVCDDRGGGIARCDCRTWRGAGSHSHSGIGEDYADNCFAGE